MTNFVSVGTGTARIQDLSMNPQKLAGQCAKLKCCINFEIDSYSEAHKKLPPKDVTLETKDATYFYFKPDILARKITYSTDRSIPANLITITAKRAFEIIALNRQGIKVESLDPSQDKENENKVLDLVEQESLTRFDNSKKKKKKRSGRDADSKPQPPRENGDTRSQQNPNGEKQHPNGEARSQQPTNGEGRSQQPKNGESRGQQPKNKGRRQAPQQGQRRPRPQDEPRNKPAKNNTDNNKQ